MTNAPSTYMPRACDCEFCRSHGAAYVSDSNGTLSITIVDKREVNKYRQGSRIAEFIICKKCGVLTHVCYEEDGAMFGSINIRTSGECRQFGDAQAAHLMQLNDEERIRRWKENWFTNVSVEYENT